MCIFEGGGGCLPVLYKNNLNLLFLPAYYGFHRETEFSLLLIFSIPELRDQIVLSPQFLVDALKSLITAEMFCKKKPEILDKWREFRQKGILTMSLLGTCTIQQNLENLNFDFSKYLLIQINLEHTEFKD